MSHAYKTFDTRLKRIGRRRTQLTQGYTSKVSKDGLIVFRPKRRDGGFPIKGLLLLVIGLFLFKGFVIASLGDATYNARVATLQAGSTVEQVGAMLMQQDPVSTGIAQYMRPYLN